MRERNRRRERVRDILRETVPHIRGLSNVYGYVRCKRAKHRIGYYRKALTDRLCVKGKLSSLKDNGCCSVGLPLV